MGLRPLSGYSLAVRSHYKENQSAACPRNQDNKGKGADAEVMALSPSGKSVVETPAAPVPRVALGAQERGERSWTKCLKVWRQKSVSVTPNPRLQTSQEVLCGTPSVPLHPWWCTSFLWSAGLTSQLRTAGLLGTSLDPGSILSKGRLSLSLPGPTQHLRL